MLQASGVGVVAVGDIISVDGTLQFVMDIPYLAVYQKYPGST